MRICRPSGRFACITDESDPPSGLILAYWASLIKEAAAHHDDEGGGSSGRRAGTDDTDAWPRRRQLRHRRRMTLDATSPSPLKRSRMRSAERLIVRPQAQTIRMSARSFAHSASVRYGAVIVGRLLTAVTRPHTARPFAIAARSR